jgi:hypothetical protein
LTLLNVRWIGNNFLTMQNTYSFFIGLSYMLIYQVFIEHLPLDWIKKVGGLWWLRGSGHCLVGEVTYTGHLNNTWQKPEQKRRVWDGTSCRNVTWNGCWRMGSKIHSGGGGQMIVPMVNALEPKETFSVVTHVDLGSRWTQVESWLPLEQVT